jgi:hypothetical protein
MRIEVPAGYSRIDEPRGVIVGRDDVIAGLREALRAAPADAPTLHGYSAGVPGARALHGRDVAYAFALSGTNVRVVVRHNRHGGLLRSITGDLFRGATRAPNELDIALGLAELGIPTPTVLGYAVYPAGAGFSRSDVVTEEVADARDFGEVLLATNDDDAARDAAWQAVDSLLERMMESGIRHRDLNVKNILLRRAGDVLEAWLLDVDSVELGWLPPAAEESNRRRLVRSIEKWRDTRGVRLTAGETSGLRGKEPSTP